MSPRLAPFVVLVGLCVLIPLPLVDGWVERRLTRALLLRVARARAVELDHRALRTLTEDRTAFLPGCIQACLLWPIKKLFSTVLFVLLVKQGFDLGALALVRAHMLLQALDHGLLRTAETLEAEAERVRTAMEETLAEVHPSPLGRIARGAYNPAMPAPDPHLVSRFLHRIHFWSGGGAIAPKFAERLKAAT